MRFLEARLEDGFGAEVRSELEEESFGGGSDLGGGGEVGDEGGDE